VIVTKNLRN